jgi:hypothetical protein
MLACSLCPLIEVLLPRERLSSQGLMHLLVLLGTYPFSMAAYSCPDDCWGFARSAGVLGH